MHAANPGLLTPDAVQAWAAQHAYHAGDRLHLIGRSYADVLSTPSSRIAPLNTSPSVNNSKRGPFYCEVDDCKQRGKAWPTKSGYKKHQHTHMPKDERCVPYVKQSPVVLLVLWSPH